MLPELAEPQFPLQVSDIRQDLAQFDSLFGLPAAHLRVVRSLAPSASPWLANGEEVLDTEIVHAVAPGASIVELLVSATSLNDPASAVAASVAALRLGASLGGVISISAAGQAGGSIVPPMPRLPPCTPRCRLLPPTTSPWSPPQGT